MGEHEGGVEANRRQLAAGGMNSGRHTGGLPDSPCLAGLMVVSLVW